MPTPRQTVNLPGSRSYGAGALIRTPMYPGQTDVMTRPWQEYFTRNARVPTLSIIDVGGRGDGITDNSKALAKAYAGLQDAGGGQLIIPGSNDPYMFDSWVFDGGTAPVDIVGEGRATVLKRGANLSGSGLLTYKNGAKNINLRSMMIDGDTMVSTKLLYSAFGGDPLNPLLENNTSIMIEDGSSNLRFDDIVITHTGGYAVLANAVNEDITDIIFRGLQLENNRPHTFGVVDPNEGLGSWTGGVLLHGNGLSTTAMCRRISFISCSAKRCTGNAFWQHLYGFSSLHEAISFTDMRGEDLGLDFILFGGVTGGYVNGATGRRIGYVCSDDTSPSVPKWANGRWAVGIDHSGLVISTTVTGVTLTSVNGGGMDCDGMASSTVSGCTIRVPRLGEPEHDIDQIAIPGWGGGGSAGGDGPNYAYGIQTGNTSQNIGGQRNCIVGNSLINLSGGAIRIYAGQDAVVAANKIEHPSDAINPPITIGNIGVLDVQKSKNVIVSGNAINYDPSTPKACVVEDDSLGAYSGGEKNLVLGNAYVSPLHGLATEFSKAVSSSSIASLTTTVTFPYVGTLTYQSGYLVGKT